MLFRSHRLFEAVRDPLAIVCFQLVRVERNVQLAQIVFYPGTMLINLVNNVSFERYVPKKDASSESAGGGGGTDDRPGEL